MSEVQYPFIDLAVHDRVGEAFAAGMSVVVFTADLRSVCWANGRGAALFGFDSIYDFLDQGLDRAELMFRQVEPIARSLAAVGDRRSFTIRVPSGFSRVAIQARCEMIRFQGRSCVMLAVPHQGLGLSLDERAARMIEGFDDPETHMAVLGEDGTVLAQSREFSALRISVQTARMLVSMVGNDRHRLIKRPISTAGGYLPAAIGLVSEDPSLNLLFVVGMTRTQDGTVSKPAEPETVIVPATEPDLLPAAPEEEYEEALSAVAAIEDNPEIEEEIMLEDPASDPEDVQPVEQMSELDEPPAGHANELVAADEADNVEVEAERETAPEVIEPETMSDETISVETTDEESLAVAEEAGTSETATDAELGNDDLVPETSDGSDHTDAAEGDHRAGSEEIVEEADDEIEDENEIEAEAIDVKPAPQDSAEAAPAAALPLRGLRTVRFVWKIDASGRFSEVSKEFADAVGPHAADVTGMAFSDLAALFNLDPEGKIAELLGKRDTWSGKTIWWPVEGTSLVVPVDLAALPTYTRAREFDGFRGFGIVRMNDAAEDPTASGLSLGAEPDTETAQPVSALDGEAETADNDNSQDTNQEAPSADEWPAGERPALKLVEKKEQPPSDKVIRLEQHRSRLSPGEQAAFQEIARRLDTFTRSPEDDDDAAEGDRGAAGTADQTAEAEPDAETTILQDDPHRLSAALEDKGMELPSPAGDDEIGATEERPEAVETGDAGHIEPQDAREAAEEDSAEHRAADASEIDEDVLGPVGEETGSEATGDEAEGSEVGGDETPAPEHVDAQSLAQMLPGRDRTGLSVEIIDQMPVALLVHAGDRLIHANGEFLKLTGYPSIEALAETGGLDALLQRQELEGKTSEAGGMVVVTADDTLVPVTARLQSIRWNEGTALMLALMPVAPAEAQAADEEDGEVVPFRPVRPADQLVRLQVEVEELRAILETATDGVVIIGSEGEIRSMNRSASALFNFDAEEINGKPFVTLFAHESQRAIVDYLSGLAGHGVASVMNDGREVIGREASGGFIPLFMTIGRLTSSNGYCAVIRDITQWKRTEEELRTAKRAAETANAHKSEFLAHVSHEIRTPLNAIIGFADMMASERLGPVGHARYVEYANDIGRSGRHVLDIVNDLLDISKIEAGELDLDFVAVGLNETVSEAVSLVQPQANSQRVIIRTALSQAVPEVVADLRSIKQIVLNILSNAIRFTPSGGQIVVSTAYEANGSVVLRIRDTGIGMNRSELELAMKPFRQVAGASRKRGDGTGLGLPLTKAMVDANRANFAISSAPNEGTLVEVTFPSQRVLAS
jgi:PAS domain S-box-containing protein